MVDHKPRTGFAVDRECHIAGSILPEVIDRAALSVLEA